MAARRVGEIFPLTPLQRGLLYHALLEPGTDPYLLQLTARIDGPLDPEHFREAWQRLAERHAPLRTGFAIKGQREPVQVTFERLTIPFHLFDWRGLEPEEAAAAEARLLREDRARGFEPNRPPLVRVTLARIEDEAWWVLLSHHHLILDGWSQPILFAELFALLAELRGHRNGSLARAAAFTDYVDWLRRQDPVATAAFWRERLAGWEPRLLPGPGTAANPSEAVAVERVLDARTTQAIERLARSARVTPSTVFQAAWALVLERYLGTNDVLFGVTVSGRTAPLPKIERMVGMLANTLPLRLTVPASQSLTDWLADVQAEFRAIEGYAHADLAELGTLAGATADRPLFQTLVAYENFPDSFGASASATGLRISGVQTYERTNQAVALVVVPGTVTALRLRVDPRQLEPVLAGRLADLLAGVLQQMTEAPSRTVGSIDALGLPVATPRRLPRLDSARTLLTAFDETVAAHPRRTALTGPDGELSYAELDAASERVARALHGMGVGPEDRVGLCFERSLWAVVATIGALKVGAAYVPVDPRYPDERIAFTLADSGAAAVLTGGALSARLEAFAPPVLAIDAPGYAQEGRSVVRPRPDAASAAYVIYTSGSTGRPKGVVISHANVLRLFDGAARLFSFGPDDVWSVFHSFAFDFSVWEIWGALLHGGRAVIVPHDVSRDPAAFYALLAQEGVTVLSQTPSAFGQLAAADAVAPRAELKLREVVFGGEALNPATLSSWFARYGAAAPRLVNMYGITETTVHVTFRVMSQADATGTASPIGLPMPQLDVLLLDAKGRAVPDGIAGEICVAGDGLARGYLGRPALTAERFVPHPRPPVPGARLYRSGDLARGLPDGKLEYLGRIDRQVKVRGFRVEPGEIEAVLRDHPAVAQAVVMLYGEDAKSAGLCAYVVPSGEGALGEGAAEELRAYAAARLPAHMLPHAFVLLEALPLTVNGKLDAQALPDPRAGRQRAPLDALPESPVERTLAEIWAKVLGVERVGAAENYFALGGDSIRSIRIVSLAAEAGLRISVRELLEHPTVRELAQVIQAGAAAQVEALEKSAPFRLLVNGERAFVPAEAVDAYPLARLQAGMLFHAETGRADGLYLDLQTFRLRMPVDEAPLRAALAQTVADFPTLRTGFVLGAARRPLQFVLPQAELPLVWSDLRDRSRDEQEAVVAAYLAAERGRSYDLERPPLVRVAVHRLEEGLIQLTISLHHAILDGWSVALWESALLERYFAARAGLPPPALPTVPGYASFVAAEHAALADSATRAFWEARLAGAPRPAIPRWTGPAANSPPQSIHFAGEVARALGELARAAGLPLKSVLLAVVGHVACRAAGTSALPVGLVTNGRPECEGGDAALGLFLNTLPVVLRAHGSWRTLAQAALEEEAAILGVRRFPMHELLRMNGGVAPFECSVNFVHFHAFRGLSDRLPVSVVSGYAVEAVDIPFSFNFTLDPNGDGLTFQLLTAPDVPVVQRDWIVAAVCRGVEDAALSLDGFAGLLDARDAADELVASNRTEAELDRQPVHERVLARLAATPGAAVLRDAGGRHWTGGELAELAEEFGRRLADRVERGTPVLLWLPRGPRLVAAMLAVLRAGGAYVPLDAAVPAARAAKILDELATLGGGPAVLCDRATAERIPSEWRERIIVADDTPPPSSAAIATASVDGDDLAYVVFTSGSTGRPKGVMIPHGALANHMGWMASRFGLQADDVVLQRTSPAFDAAIWEFWAPLLEGSLLACAPDAATKDPAALLDALAESGATVLQLVPSLLDALLAFPIPERLRLRRLFCGGEALRGDLAAQAGKRLALEVVNLYGPTEATIDATFATACGQPGATVPIGCPVSNVRAYVLDERLEPVPPGAPGELCLAGAGLGRGYAGRPAMTAERFVPDPFDPAGGRLYRTGDVVRRLPDGALHYIGRADRQVKLGGNRLELGEVEAVLARYPGMRRVAVAVEEGAGAPRLVAYLEGTPDPGLTGALGAWLAEQLPSYAIPHRFGFVADWPLLPSGKTDTARLPELARALRAADGAAVDLDGPREREMAAIWAAILGVEVGAVDDFFALGGDSILALQVAARARRAGFAVGPGDIFRYPTVRALCAVAVAAARAESVPLPPSEPLPATALARWFFGLELARPNHWNQALLLRCPKGLGREPLVAAVDRMARRHDAFRLRFHQTAAGPSMQVVAPAVAVDGFEVADEAALATACRTAQEGLDLASGPLFRARLLRYEGNSDDRLLLVGHHLVVDGVSWRILLEELSLWLEDPAAGPGAPAYPFTRWAEAAAALRPDPVEVAFWRAEAARSLATLPVRTGLLPLEGRTRSLTRSLGTDATEALLRDARERLRAEMTELLLGALGSGLTALLGERETAVLIERHGRYAVPEVDVSRTVGWFTALHPVRLRLRAAPAAAVHAAKEALRRVPAGGAGYLRLMQEDAEAAPPFPQVSLNYLGQFDASLRGSLRPAPEGSGPSSDPANRRTTLLDVVGLVEGGRLHLSANFDAEVLPEEHVVGLLDGMLAGLEALAAMPWAQALGAWDGADLPGCRLGTTALRELTARVPDLMAIYPTSPVQRGLLFQSRLAGAETGVYVQQVIAAIDGALDPQRLLMAWQAVTDRHEALRSCFLERGDEPPLQLVRTEIEPPFADADWSMLPSAEQEARFAQVAGEERARGFDVAEAPLSRLLLVRLGARRWRLLWTHHHLVMDGWSLPILFADLLSAYERSGALPPGPSLGAAVRWQLAIDQAALLEQAAIELADLGEPSLVSGAVRGTAGATAIERLTLPEEVVGALSRLTRSVGVSLACAVNAGFAVALGRHLGRSDVVHGVTVSGRSADVPGIEGMVGLFIATLPLRTRWSGDRPVAELLRDVQAGLAAANERARLSLGELQAKIGRGPLFDTIVVFENYPVDPQAAGGAGGFEVSSVRAVEQNHYPLSLYAHPGADRLELALHFDPQRIAPAWAQRFLKAVASILTSWASDAVRAVGAAPSLPQTAARELLAGGAGPVLPVSESVEERVAAQARAFPDATALLAGERRLSYGMLLARADRIATALHARGIGAEDRVAVLLPREADLSVTLLGVLRAGAAFVPLDPSFPRARLATIIEDAAPRLLVTAGGAIDDTLPSGLPAVMLSALLAEASAASAPPEPAAPLDALAYINFTSGSTGRPKGVAVSRRALANACAAFSREPGLSRGDVVAAVTTVSFDIALNELLLPWTVGATVALLDRQDASNGVRLAERLNEVGATVLQATPATWRLLVAAGWNGSDRLRAWCGGDALPVDLAAAIAARTELWNLYGPTETTIWSSVGRLRAGEPVDAGGAIDNTRLYVVDRDGQLVPPGVAGELLVGGAGVARGYVGQPAATAAAFAPDPFAAPGAVAYRTGDLARWTARGRIEILGRVDRQIKINGYRVEPAEVEVALRSAPGVGDAACTVRQIGGSPALVAFFVPADAPVDPEAVRRHAAARLPAYMLPALLLPLAVLPLTANGKTDYNGLPDHRSAVLAAGGAVAPRDPVEEAVLILWQEAFERTDFGVEDDFFELGGHSLLATQIHARLGRIFQGRIPLREMFDAPTVAQLAQRLAASELPADAVTRAAELFVRLRRMTPQERAALRQRAGAAGHAVEAG